MNLNGTQDPAVVTPRAAALIASLSKIPKGQQRRLALRASIREALADGTVGLAQVGDALLALDMALGDAKSAERDAIAVLRVNRQNGVANAVVGAVCNTRGDYERAERYLRRALAADPMSASANNDLAEALMRLGRAEEDIEIARARILKKGRSGAFSPGASILEGEEGIAERADEHDSPARHVGGRL